MQHSLIWAIEDLVVDGKIFVSLIMMCKYLIGTHYISYGEVALKI